MHLISWNKFVQQKTIYKQKRLSFKHLIKTLSLWTSSEWELFLQRLNTEEFHQLNCIPLEMTGADAFMELVFAHC